MAEEKNVTGIIRYNLNDRGRKFRGKVRNFNIPAIVATINSGATQEKVKHRDMFGYYGHWPRVKFGMIPSEGGIVEGKQVVIEPAMVTVYLKAYDDGTVEHEAEFLDTNAGKLAKQLYKRRVGGFSSAIDENRPEFYGFDYVLEPNFSTNRGYEIALDSMGAGMALDDVGRFAAAEYNEQLVGVLKLLDSLNSEHAQALQVVANLTLENEHYLSMISARTGSLDSVSMESINPVITDMERYNKMVSDIQSFDNATLFSVAVPKLPQTQEDKRADDLVGMFIR